jgi:predicted nucleic acid-binding protein
MRNASITTKNIMSKARIFLDSSALIAGVLSSAGASRVLLVMAEMGDIDLLINEHVIVECERSLAKKVPEALPELRQTIKDAGLKILKDASPKEVQASLYVISDPNDAPILAAAIKAKVDFLVTHDRRHFLDDPKIAKKSGLQIGTPGDALAWLKQRML